VINNNNKKKKVYYNVFVKQEKREREREREVMINGVNISQMK